MKRFPARSPSALAPRGSRPEPADADLLDALDLLRQRRRPYGDLLAQIVADTMARLPPLPDRPIVEIGAGTGQLREWMPSTCRDRMIHTDPSAAALRLLRERAPQARTRVAPAENLPFPDAAAGAALGLCVFDALPDHAAVVAELGRVLAPGACFIHLMDMATLLERPFEKLASSRLVPLPNVFGDPGDHEWPLDMILVAREWLEGLLALGEGATPGAAASRALAASFGAYFVSFGTGPFDAAGATSAFKAIASSGERRRALAGLLQAAATAAFAEGYPPIQPVPFHSGRYLQSVLEEEFRKSGLFRIEVNEIVARAAWEPADQGRPLGYRSLCLGHQRLGETPPGRLLTETAHQLMRAGGGRSGAATLTEAGIFVFAARRTF